MFFGIGMMCDGQALSPMGNNAISDSIKISNGIFSHLALVNLIEDKDDTAIPTKWTDKMLLNANFNNTLEGGTINEFIGSIDHLELQRKAYNENEWLVLQKIYPINSTIKPFTINDTTAKCGTQYTYQIVPIGKNGEIGYGIELSVVSLFDDAYVADANHIYKITAEYEIGSSNQNIVSAVQTPYGAKYPVVGFNAVTNYASQTVTAILLAPTSQSRYSNNIDRMAQVKLVNEFNEWLTNGKTKIIKDFNGNLKVVVVVNAVSNSYYKSLGNGIASTTFNYIEIGDLTQKYTDKLGLTNQFDIIYKE